MLVIKFVGKARQLYILQRFLKRNGHLKLSDIRRVEC